MGICIRKYSTDILLGASSMVHHWQDVAQAQPARIIDRCHDCCPDIQITQSYQLYARIQGLSDDSDNIQELCRPILIYGFDTLHVHVDLCSHWDLLLQWNGHENDYAPIIFRLHVHDDELQ